MSFPSIDSRYRISSASTTYLHTCLPRATIGRHLMGRHLMGRRLMGRHLIGKHLMGIHIKDGHIMNRHLMGRHLMGILRAADRYAYTGCGSTADSYRHVE